MVWSRVGGFGRRRKRSTVAAEGDGDEETKKLDALAKRVLNDEEREGEMEVVVTARRCEAMEAKMARDMREVQEWVLGSFDALERGRKTEEVVRVTFRGCADVLDGEAFGSTSNEKSAEEERESL